MRTLITFISLLLVFQPVSWAHGMSMNADMGAAQTMQLDAKHGSAQLIGLAHHQTDEEGAVSSQLGLGAQKLIPPSGAALHNHNSYNASYDCLHHCLTFCVNSNNLTQALSLDHQYIGIVYQQPLTAYRTHLSLPQFRPPKYIRS